MCRFRVDPSRQGERPSNMKSSEASQDAAAVMLGLFLIRHVTRYRFSRGYGHKEAMTWKSKFLLLVFSCLETTRQPHVNVLETRHPHLFMSLYVRKPNSHGPIEPPLSSRGRELEASEATALKRSIHKPAGAVRT